jgi:hypothetical protein
MNEFLIKNGLIVSGSTNISGSVTALSFIGSVSGSATSASFSSTASYVNPLSQSILITGSLELTGNSTISGILTANSSSTIAGPLTVNFGGITGGTSLFINGNTAHNGGRGISTTGYEYGIQASHTMTNNWNNNPQAAGVYGTGDIGINGSGNLIGVTGNSAFFTSLTGLSRINAKSSTTLLQIRGTGTTSATTALLVQDSNASNSLIVLDNRNVGINVLPSKSLHINGDYRQSYSIEYWNYYLDYAYTVFDGSDVGLAVNHQNVGSTYNNVYTIRKGNFAIGTSSTTDKFTVLGSSNFIGNTKLTGSLSITGSLSTSSAALTVYKSGSTTLDIQGSQGQLFSIVDSLSGSLMSVNDVSGLPILEVFSNDTVVMGTYGTPAVIITGSTMNVTGSLVTQGQVLDPAFIWFMS